MVKYYSLIIAEIRGFDIIYLHRNATNGETGNYFQQINEKFSAIVYTFLIWIFPTLNTCIFTLIPQHDVIKMPEYWYELVFIFISGYLLIGTLSMIFHGSLLMNVDYVKSFKAFWILFLSSSIAFALCYVLAYILWVYVLKYHHPLPFGGYICAILSVIALWVSLWFHYPLEWRNNYQFRKRLKNYILLGVMPIFTSFIYNAISFLFSVVSVHFQWILAFPLPIVQHVLMKINVKVENDINVLR